MTTQCEVVAALSRAAAGGDSVVLGSVVRVVGSSYGGVGARMLVQSDGSVIGLVSGGCLESDLAEHAQRVARDSRTEVVRYDTRDDDDAPWGLGLGCNGLIDVLLEPLAPTGAQATAMMMGRALAADTPSVLATVIHVTGPMGSSAAAVGAHALFAGDAGGAVQTIGNWGDGSLLAQSAAQVSDAIETGRRGLVREFGSAGSTAEIAFEVVPPAVRLVVCGSGPDAAPIAHFAARLGWDVTVVDHRPITDARAARFPGATVVQCIDAQHLADVVQLTPRTAAVVMSHNFTRDLDYVQVLLAGNVTYLGVLGPRARGERMLDDLAARGVARDVADSRLFAPVGMDIGGDGPEAIALAVIAEASAVTSGRAGGHLRDSCAPLHHA